MSSPLYAVEIFKLIVLLEVFSSKFNLKKLHLRIIYPNIYNFIIDIFTKALNQLF